jgi:8-oxo-dGTP diphosphatase
MAYVYTEAENLAWLQTLPAKHASASVAFVRDGMVLMVKPNYKDRWTFPGGIIEENESPIAAAAREAAEEIGFAPGIENLDFVTIAYGTPKRAFPDHLKFVFRSRIIPDDTQIVLQDSEIDDYAWVPLEDVAEVSHSFGVYREIGSILAHPGYSRGYIET